MANIQLQNFNKKITQQETQQYLRQVLGERSGQFVNNLVALVANSEQLQRCEPMSVMFSAIKATALELPLDPALGFAYVIPYNDSKSGTTLAQFQIGAKGFKQLALRTGLFKTINESDVREGEIVSQNRLSGEIEFAWIQDEAERETKKIVGYVSYFELTNGFRSVYYKSIESLEKHGKKYSQTYKKGFGNWKDDFDAMCRKTVVKLNLSKNAPLSVEMREAIKSDQAVIKSDSEVEYVDNTSTEIAVTQEQKDSGAKKLDDIFKQ